MTYHDLPTALVLEAQSIAILMAYSTVSTFSKLRYLGSWGDRIKKEVFIELTTMRSRHQSVAKIAS